jgi:hypothetical protein
MNAELYGGADPPSPATILDYRRTKRPPPFERLAAVRARLRSAITSGACS